MPKELRIRLDAVWESLLGTLAARHGRSAEEEAGRLLARELQRIAEERVDLERPEEALKGTPRDKHQ